MDRSRETLLRVESNDPTLKVIRIDWRADTLIGGQIEGYYIKFNANDVGDYTTLGASIARNTQLRVLNIFVCNTGHTDTAAASDFIDGLKQNTSINSLRLQCNDNIVAGNDINGILEAYRLNGNLTRLSIGYTGNIELYIPRVRGFTNLNYVSLHRCNISSEQLLSIVEAIRGHRLLEELHLVYPYLRFCPKKWDKKKGALSPLNHNFFCPKKRDKIAFTAYSCPLCPSK